MSIFPSAHTGRGSGGSQHGPRVSAGSAAWPRVSTAVSPGHRSGQRGRTWANNAAACGGTPLYSSLADLSPSLRNKG